MPPRRSRLPRSRSHLQPSEEEVPTAYSPPAASFRQATGPLPRLNSRNRRIVSPEVILISDDESEEDPIAAITSDQESVFQVSESLQDILQKVENVIQQTLTDISSGRRRDYDLLPFITDSLKDIQRVGGIRLAGRCEIRLTCLEELIYHLEDLVDFDPYAEATPLMIDAQTQRVRERKSRVRRISEQEIIVANLYERQRSLRSKIDAYNSIAERTGIRTVQGERTLKDFELESTRVQNVYRGELEILHTLRREDVTADAAFILAYTKLQKEEEERVRVEHVEQLAAVEAAIASFSLLDLI